MDGEKPAKKVSEARTLASVSIVLAICLPCVPALAAAYCVVIGVMGLRRAGEVPALKGPALSSVIVGGIAVAISLFVTVDRLLGFLFAVGGGQ